MASRFVGLSLLALLVLLATGCGGGKPQRTLSPGQVVSALRQHGIRARTTWRASDARATAPMNGFLGLSGARLISHWGAIALVQASFKPLNAPPSAREAPYVDALVTQTVEQAQRLTHRAPSGSNGRTLNVANVVLQVYRSAVPRIAASVLDLMIQAAGLRSRGGLILRAG